MAERLFSIEELEHMGIRTVDKLKEAIDSGDKAGATKLAERMYNEFLSMHDLYVNWITATLSEVARKHGDEELEEVMNVGVEAWWGPISKRFPEGQDNLKKKLRMFIGGLHGHLQPLEIVEDDEKVTVYMKPCGSGGRLVQNGGYEEPINFYRIEKGQRLTYGIDNMPVYCAHESAMELVDMDGRGTPFVVVEPAEKIGEGLCRLIVYKDPADIPERYYERVGRTKPAAA